MIIKGIGKRLEFYKIDKKLTFSVLGSRLNLSKASIQKIIDTDLVIKTETFFRLFNVLELDLIEYFKNENIMTQINNVNQNNGTIQNNVIQESRKELELIIKHQKNEIAALKDSLKRADEMIEILKR